MTFETVCGGQQISPFRVFSADATELHPIFAPYGVDITLREHRIQFAALLASFHKTSLTNAKANIRRKQVRWIVLFWNVPVILQVGRIGRKVEAAQYRGERFPVEIAFPADRPDPMEQRDLILRA